MNRHADSTALVSSSKTVIAFVGGRNLVITILIILAVLMWIGAIPAWPHSRNWGYAPSGTLGLIVIILIVLLLLGRI